MSTPRTFSVLVYGDPEGKPRPRLGGHGGFYTPKTDWDEAVRAQTAFAQGRPKEQLKGPLHVDVVFYLPRPKSVPVTHLWCPQKPDGDNAEKATWDAMTFHPEKNPRGWWKDDKQIVSWSGKKMYCPPDGKPGALVVVTELEDR